MIETDAPLKVCRVCKTAKAYDAFPRNKHRPDGTGRASVCRECALAHNRGDELVLERKRDWWNDQWGVKMLRERRAETKEVLARHKAEKAALLAQRKVCRRCGRQKGMAEFPKNKYNMMPGEGGRSRICRQCYAEMPDGAAEQARERSRDYHRVMYSPEHAKQLMMEESAKRYRDRKQKWSDRAGLEEVLAPLKVDAEAFEQMTREERRAALLPLLGKDE